MGRQLVFHSTAPGAGGGHTPDVRNEGESDSTWRDQGFRPGALAANAVAPRPRAPLSQHAPLAGCAASEHSRAVLTTHSGHWDENSCFPKIQLPTGNGRRGPSVTCLLLLPAYGPRLARESHLRGSFGSGSGLTHVDLIMSHFPLPSGGNFESGGYSLSSLLYLLFI